QVAGQPDYFREAVADHGGDQVFTTWEVPVKVGRADADLSAAPAPRSYLGRTPSSSSVARMMKPTMMTSQIHPARLWNLPSLTSARGA
ncbi:hypothetical protein, partial [Streptosporangium sp. NPDC003464]